MARHSERKRRRREAASFETLTAERMATTGHAVARATDGRVVLVRGAIVGERFEARWTRLRTAAQGELVKVLQASPMRRRPDCEYVDRCGGCDWMHIHDEAQLRLQQQSLEQLCQRAGLHPLPEVVAHRCGPPLRYRQRARISLRVNNGKVQLGYHRWRAHQLVNVSDCLVLAPALTQAFAGLRRALRGAAGEGEAALSLGTGGRVVVALR
ncbi:MAG TPA: hypothetical protein ENK23_04990, partial [Sorangium sp.]|nr:hypothetical protein [Sorangium sp.]